jgi:hypothetical protein
VDSCFFLGFSIIQVFFSLAYYKLTKIKQIKQNSTARVFLKLIVAIILGRGSQRQAAILFD